MLLDRARRGEAGAFAVILAHHDRRLRALAGWLLVPAPTVDTALAETYLKAFRGLPRLTQGADTGRWLLRLTTIVCLDRVRRTGRSPVAHQHLDDDSGPGRLGAALAQLPLDQRAVVVLMAVEGLDEREVGEVLGLDPATVGVRHRQALSALAAVTVGAEDEGVGNEREGRPDGIRRAAADYLAIELSSGLGADVGWLGDELAALPVVEHAEGFWEDFAERLEVERARSTPALPPPAGAVAADEVQLRPDRTNTVGDLARQARAARSSKGRARRVGLGVAVLVVLGGLVALVLALSGEERITEAPPPQTTATDVADEVAGAMAEADLVSGSVTETVIVPGATSTATTSQFARDAEGSFRVVPTAGPDEPAPIAYDATTGTFRTVIAVPGLDGAPVPTVVEEAGLAAGGPDAEPSRSLLGRAQAMALAAMRSDPDAVVREQRLAGAPVWVVDAAIAEPRSSEPGQPSPPDRVRVVIDQGLTLPVEIAAADGDEPRWSVELSEVTIDGPPPAGGFGVPSPPLAPVQRTDAGFVRVPIGDVAAITGTRAVRPELLPDGYELAEVAVRPGAARVSPGEANPPSGDVVSLAYRRGFEEVVVTTRRDLGGGQPWTDPFGPGGDARPVAVTDGRFPPAEAQLVTGTAPGPHLWVVADDTVITVSGDVSPDDLVRIAESLT